MSLATSGLICKAMAMLVKGPKASTQTFPGSLLTFSAMNSAADLLILRPCRSQTKLNESAQS